MPRQKAGTLDHQPIARRITTLNALSEPIHDPEAAQRWLDGLKTEERSARTVRDIWLSAAHTVYGWAKRKRLIEVNPFEGCVVEVPRKAERRGEGKAFSDAEASTILRAALQVENRPGHLWDAARRWVPWLCAYTGARVGEVTQLRAQDIDAACKTVRITPDAGTVKTGKVRVVPLHPHLVEMGFLDFVDFVRDAMGPEAPLFYRKPARPSRNPNYRGPAVKTRERLAEWVRGLGITDPDIQPNHAWRHTFKTRAARAKIDEGIRDKICGHGREP